MSPPFSVAALVWRFGMWSRESDSHVSRGHMDWSRFCYLGWKIAMIKLLLFFFFFYLEKQILCFCNKSLSAKLRRIIHPVGPHLRHSADSSRWYQWVSHLETEVALIGPKWGKTRWPQPGPGQLPHFSAHLFPESIQSKADVYSLIVLRLLYFKKL